MYNRSNSSDRELNLQIRMDNIRNQMNLLSNMIDKLQDQLNKPPKKIRHVMSDDTLSQFDQDEAFNSSGLFEISDKEIKFTYLKKESSIDNIDTNKHNECTDHGDANKC